MTEMITQKTIFNVLQPGVCLTVQDLVAATGLDRKAVCRACVGLVANEYLQRRERGCYELTPDGIAVKDGLRPLKSKIEYTKPQRRKKTFRARLWRAIRRRLRFKVSELLELASDGNGKAEYSNAKLYVKLLVKHGVLMELRRGADINERPGNGEKRYELINDLGLSAPVFTRQTVGGANAESGRCPKVI